MGKGVNKFKEGFEIGSGGPINNYFFAGLSRRGFEFSKLFAFGADYFNGGNCREVYFDFG